MNADLDKIKDIIEKSGNTFHCKVVNFFEEKGWTVLVSPYYNDNVSDKPREIDIVAEKAFDLFRHAGKSQGTINIRLIIECKYVGKNNNVVFWFHDKDIHKTEEMLSNTTHLRKGSAFIKQHHYLSNTNEKVAKLFASKADRKNENELFYKALNQSLNAMVHYRNTGSIIKPNLAKRVNIRRKLNYPIIICNNFENLYRVEIGEDDKDPICIDENFKLEVNYAYLDQNKKHLNEYFLIDILNFLKLDDFLSIIEDDKLAIEHMMR